MSAELEVPPADDVLRWYECERKVRHLSWDDALAAGLDAHNNGHGFEANAPGPYVCPWCGFYHVGRSAGRKNNRRTRIHNARRRWAFAHAATAGNEVPGNTASTTTERCG